MFSRRIKLSVFLVVTMVIGSTAGMVGRWQMTRARSYEGLEALFDNYSIRAMWQDNAMGQQKLLYLIVFPEGGVAISSAYLPGIATARKRPGIGLFPEGIFKDGVRVPHSDEGRLWILQTSSQQIAEVDPGPLGLRNISRAEFAKLGDSEIWKKVLKPRADAESEAFRNSPASENESKQWIQ